MSQQWTITKDKFLTLDEIQHLYAELRDARDLAIQRQNFHCHIRDYFILRTLLESGLRCLELSALKIEDIRGGSLIVKSGKNGKSRNVLLTKETQRMLAEFIKLKAKVLREPTSTNDYLFVSERGSHYTTRGIRKRVKFWFARVGIGDGLSVHSCRNTYVSHALAAGVDMVTVRNNAGHSSLAVTSIYSHATKNDLGDFELYSSASSTKRNC